MHTQWELPFELDPAWGSVRVWERECPGVYYISLVDDSGIGRELYAVEPEAASGIISKEALLYGTQSGGIQIFVPDDQGLTGWSLIKFEIARYRVKQKHTLENNETIYSQAICSAERYPAYFGGISPPRDTPWGAVIRVKKAAEGVYFLESVHCEWVFAVAQPVWADCLSEYAQKCGETLKSDLEIGEPESVYRYFKSDRCEPAIFELLNDNSYSGLYAFIHSREALENELHQNFPEYVLAYNANILRGKGFGNVIGSMLEEIKYPIKSDELRQKLQYKIDECIHFHSEIICKKLLALP